MNIVQTFYVSKEQQAILKRYASHMLRNNDKPDHDTYIKEIVEAELYLYGSIGFDKEVEKKREFLSFIDSIEKTKKLDRIAEKLENKKPNKRYSFEDVPF